MKRTVILEKSLKSYLKTIKSDVFSFGLVLGQVSTDTDLVIHLSRTQVPKELLDGKVCLKNINDIKEEWITDHVHNIIPILPGGVTILGVFFVGNGDVFANSSSVDILKSLLSAIDKFVEQNEYYFVHSKASHKLVLHGSDDTGLSCKCFISSPDGFNFDTVECIFATIGWHRISCYYDFEHVLPLYVKSISNAILHDKIMDILKYVSKSVKESILLFNGEIRNLKEPIKNIKEQLNKRIPQTITQSEVTTDILVDLYATCVRQLPEKSFEISDYMAELKCFGTLCSDVYLHDKAIVDDAIRAIKEDIIRSLYSRLTMHCNSLLEDLNTSSPDETKIIHEPPRRMSVLLPYSKVRFTDYLFPGEESVNTLPAREQLDIKASDARKLYEPLEIEIDATEFYSSPNTTKDCQQNSDCRKSKLRQVVSLCAVISILVIIFAVVLQKLRI